MGVSLRSILVAAALAGCGGQSSDGACTASTQCDLAVGGVCTTAPSQKQYCAYPDASCPGIGGYRWSTYAGDGLASQCFTVPVVTVTVQGAGSGTVTSEPPGISCPGTCSAPFPTGQSVRLDVDPASGAGFAGWSGDAAQCGFDAHCTLPLTGAKSAVARVEPGGYVAWAVKVEAAQFAFIDRVVLAPDGDIVVLGEYAGLGSLHGYVLPTAPPNHAGFFVGKLSPVDGGVRWARGFVGQFVRAQDIAVDTDTGDLVVTGVFSGPLDLGAPQPLMSQNGGDMFVVRIRGTDGGHVWSVPLRSTADEPDIFVAIDQGKVLAMGQHDRVIDLGSAGTLTANGNCNVFFIWYAFANGALLSDPAPKSYGDPGACLAPQDAKVDAAHNPVMTGFFFGTTRFGGDSSHPSYTDRGGLDVFVAKYDPAGTLSWVVTGGGASTSGTDQVRSMTVGPTNHVYVTGNLDFVTPTDAMDFNGVPLVGTGGVGSEVFVVDILPDGSVGWVRRFGGAGDESGQAVAADADGDVVVSGTFVSSFSFDGYAVSMNGAGQGFLCTLSSPNGGSVLGAQDYGGVNNEYFNGLIIDGSTRHRFAVGQFQSITMLGDKVLTATGTDASFVARIVSGMP